MDRPSLPTSVEVALASLYDRVKLATNPVGRLLSADGDPAPVDRLQRALLAVIDSLRPTAGSPPTSAAARRHRYLQRRYVDGQSHDSVAHELGLSLRHAHRIQTEAIGAVATAIWEKHLALTRSVRPGPSDLVRDGTKAEIPSSRSTLDRELVWLRREPTIMPSDLGPELDEALRVIDPLARQRGTTVESALPRESWPVMVERSLLHQMIILLATAALDMQTTGRIWVAANTVNGLVALDIVYAWREMGDATDFVEDQRLAYVRQIAAAQGGSVEVLRGEGNRVLRLLLPLVITSTVLAIDDNPEVALLFEAFLGGTRYRLARARTAQSALRIAEQVRPAVIILDVILAFQDGWAIFRRLRANVVTRAIPIIVCSILPEREVALAFGAAGFLTKPVTRQSLIAALDRCCPPN